MDARLSRFTSVLAALALVSISACEEAPVVRPAVPTVTPKKDALAWDQAQRRKARGLDTAKERAEYVHILADACEARHDPWACIEAATVDKRVGRTLLYHGCSLGERDACMALVDAEVKDSKRERAAAVEDARLALHHGCATYSPGACSMLDSWYGQPSYPSDAIPRTPQSP